MSELTPMSRAMMQELKSQKDEEARQHRLSIIIREIYKEAVEVAATTTESCYNHEVPSIQMSSQHPSSRRRQKDQYLQQKKRHEEIYKNHHSPPPFTQSYYQGASDPFHIKNMKDILAGLKALFPECKVTHTLMARKNDGTLYDISKLDDAILPFVNELLQESYIVVDWS